MLDLDHKINELEARLESLVRTQIGFQAEITSIRNELTRLRVSARFGQPKAPTASPEAVPRPWPAEPPPPVNREPVRYVPPHESVPPRPEPSAAEGSQSSVQDYFTTQADRARSDLERFIGENLISKIGILILILGVGIGAKYAIDNDLISPLTRIVLGYMFGFGLLGLAGKLKAKYHNFSAVLLSGSLAIMYFITYFAYATYQLIGQTTAFPLMVILTAFAVVCAVLYDRQIIAHVGLVGAYAVPFLLSSDSGRYTVLFAYMSVINAGVLAISARKYWRPIFYTASVFTWLIFGGWIAGKYDPASHFGLALTFLAIFAAIFYATKIVHGLLYPERDADERSGAILGTGFIFYCFCLVVGDFAGGLTNYAIFFAYLSAAAMILLISSWKFHGRVMLYLTYPFTWAIFGYWFARHYAPGEHFVLAAVFAGIFFAIFYSAGLIYKLVFEDLEDSLTAGLILTNSFIFYGFTMGIAESRALPRSFEGLLTVGHAAIHSIVSQAISRLKANSDIVVHALTVLVLTFSTIAIPIQFDGNVVTIVWAVEAAALFAIGRLRGLPLFEYFSYPVMIAGALSLFADWVMVYGDRVPYPSDLNRMPFANGDFVTGLVFVAAAAAIFVVNRDKNAEPPVDKSLAQSIGYAAAAGAIAVLYNTFRLEISNYHHRWLVSALQALEQSPSGYRVRDIDYVNLLTQIIYSMLFIAVMQGVNLRKARSQTLAFVSAGATAFALFAYFTVGMFLMYELRVSYMAGSAGTSINIGIRCAVYVAVALMLGSGYASSRNTLITERTGREPARMIFEIALTITLFVTLSCELLNLIAQFSSADGTKLGLSILWGLFALGMVIYGIAFDRKYQRLAAICLLAVTLVKLFLYDINDLGTIPKTVLFITLGILLLVVSFLYNKYKYLILAAAASKEAPEDEL
jgi:hypothetical protein